ncbi:hypothetical protein BH11BAC2_BH11BAC2_11550 [soil metagenome]
MKIDLRIILVLFFLPVTAFAQHDVDYFEGSIEYLITYESHLEGVSADQLKMLKGAEMIFSVKNGNTSRAYYDEFHHLIEKKIFLTQSCRNYQWSVHNDSTIAVDPVRNTYNTLEFKLLPDTTIDGLILKGIFLVLQSRNEKNATPVSFTYYFYQDLKADPHWTSCIKDGEWGRALKQMKSWAYWYKVDYPGFYSAVFSATRINRTSLQDIVFQVDAIMK